MGENTSLKDFIYLKERARACVSMNRGEGAEGKAGSPVGPIPEPRDHDPNWLQMLHQLNYPGILKYILFFFNF